MLVFSLNYLTYTCFLFNYSASKGGGDSRLAVFGVQIGWLTRGSPFLLSAKNGRNFRSLALIYVHANIFFLICTDLKNNEVEAHFFRKSCVKAHIFQIEGHIIQKISRKGLHFSG